jgi:coenzyme F420 hydrogenase subunit delta
MILEAETLVVGCGNILFQDDGFGPRVAQELSNYELPPDIRVIDGGTGAPHLIFTLLDDTCKKLTVDELPKGKFIDAHNWTLSEPLHALKGKVEMVIIGCQPAKVSEPDIVMELTPEVENAVPAAIQMVLDELGIDHEHIRQDKEHIRSATV